MMLQVVAAKGLYRTMYTPSLSPFGEGLGVWLFSFEKETWRNFLLKYVKARSGKEVAHMPHSGQARPQQTGAQIKLYLVMGVDEKSVRLRMAKCCAAKPSNSSIVQRVCLMSSSSSVMPGFSWKAFNMAAYTSSGKR